MSSHTLPTQHIAGDSFAATLSGTAYSAADGWVAQLVLIGPGRYTVTSTASGSDHAVAADAATTAVWVPGAYTCQATYTKAAQRYSETVGPLLVRPDPASVDTDAAAISPAQAVYDTLQAAYRAYLASGKFTTQAYTVAGRSMTYRSLPELLAALNAARRDVEAEQANARVAAGLSARQRFVVRM